MSIGPFASDEELVTFAFAKAFFCSRVETFRKDVAICMRPDAQRRHAYFPALIICIAFTELLSGLYAGKLKNNGLGELKRYAKKFMKADYTSDPRRLDILYEFLRHKIAHLAYPYPVFDTDTKQRTFKGQPRRRVTWTINASKRRPAIEVIDFPTPKLLKKTPTPWSVSYNCRIKISVRTFYADVVGSIYGPSGYLRHLQSDQEAQESFAKCMIEYFPRDGHCAQEAVVA
jgi:hypothetical protein